MTAVLSPRKIGWTDERSATPDPRPPAKPCAYCAGAGAIFQGSTLLGDRHSGFRVESDFGPIGLPVVCKRCGGTGREPS